MTVRRSATAVIEAPKRVVADRVRSLLAEKPYGGVWPGAAADIFRTTIKTAFFMLPTQLEIMLDDHGDKTQVTVQSRSQVFIRADVFGMYDRYIRRLLISLGADFR